MCHGSGTAIAAVQLAPQAAKGYRGEALEPLTKHPGIARGMCPAAAVPAVGEAAMMVVTQPCYLRAPGANHPGLVRVTEMSAMIIVVAEGMATMQALQTDPWRGFGTGPKALLGPAAMRA